MSVIGGKIRPPLAYRYLNFDRISVELELRRTSHALWGVHSAPNPSHDGLSSRKDLYYYCNRHLFRYFFSFVFSLFLSRATAAARKCNVKFMPFDLSLSAVTLHASAVHLRINIRTFRLFFKKCLAVSNVDLIPNIPFLQVSLLDNQQFELSITLHDTIYQKLREYFAATFRLFSMFVQKQPPL